MNKVLVVISFLVSMVITIAHDAIHHHHNTNEDTEFFSKAHSNDNGKNDNDDHHNHFPPHQHLISESDLSAGRNTFSSGKVINHYNLNLALLEPPASVNDSITYYSGFVRIIRKPLSPISIIIPVNSTRGSPIFS